MPPPDVGRGLAGASDALAAAEGSLALATETEADAAAGGSPVVALDGGVVSADGCATAVPARLAGPPRAMKMAAIRAPSAATRPIARARRLRAEGAAGEVASMATEMLVACVPPCGGVTAGGGSATARIDETLDTPLSISSTCRSRSASAVPAMLRTQVPTATAGAGVPPAPGAR